jgi:hypothetical protein
VDNKCAAAPELRGFIPPKGWPQSIDLYITGGRRGLRYCAEKTYTIVEGVNFIIANGRERFAILG